MTVKQTKLDNKQEKRTGRTGQKLLMSYEREWANGCAVAMNKRASGGGQ